MVWSDFVTDIELERDTLNRAMPIVSSTADGDSRGVFDVAADKAEAFVSAADASVTPGACVELLRIRPLLFGIAWKVLDRFLEEAFSAAGETPDQKRGFSIDRKRQLARDAVGRPGFLEADIWKATALTYDGTALLRNSLVHQKVYTDDADSLVGQDSGGGKLRPATVNEQEAFVHVALRLVEMASRHVPDARTDGDLRAQLARLKGIHRQIMIGAAPLKRIPQLTVLLGPATNGAYIFDVPRVRARSPFSAEPYCDLVVQFHDRPGVSLRGRLEEAPDESVTFDGDQPPDWLS